MQTPAARASRQSTAHHSDMRCQSMQTNPMHIASCRHLLPWSTDTLKFLSCNASLSSALVDIARLKHVTEKCKSLASLSISLTCTLCLPAQFWTGKTSSGKNMLDLVSGRARVKIWMVHGFMAIPPNPGRAVAGPRAGTWGYTVAVRLQTCVAASAIK